MSKEYENEVVWLNNIIKWYESLPKPLNELQLMRLKEFQERLNKINKVIFNLY